MQKKGDHKKFFDYMTKKGELRAEKQQVYHMACHARVRSMYIPGRRIDSKNFSRLGKNLTKMGRKNRGNSKFWSHKKLFPPGHVGVYVRVWARV